MTSSHMKMSRCQRHPDASNPAKDIQMLRTPDGAPAALPEDVRMPETCLMFPAGTSVIVIQKYTTPFDDRDNLLRIIPEQSTDSLWKGDHLSCQSDVVEWTADLCGANPQSHSEPHRTLYPIVHPSYTVMHRPHVIRDNIQIHFCHGQSRF
ncbi:hypothetical protein AVEN_61954-1 [Araneus ventricosus]|uniref:Uncharacterized protein n=1 Tax=Araneus ventricosus TaxID=182803 RepID=A0A4Y2V751_ARAVE|nr:hypothetical protein AVEN_61954-1 [Araneus ventricosus]